MKRFFYFLTDRLQITYYERLSVLTLGGIFILLLTINHLYRPAPAFSEDHYADIIADFHERVQIRDAAQQELMARYYPDTSATQLPAATERTELASNVDLAAAQPSSPTSVQASVIQASETPAAPSQFTAETMRAETAAVSEPQNRPRTTSAPLSPETKININTADADELVKLPGIGPAIAARIIEYRTENGPFQEISEIKNVRGIGQARFEAIKDYITTEQEN